MERADSVHAEGSLPSIYFSFLGLAKARCSRLYEEGIALCKQALEREFFRAENHLNLATIYALKHDRASAHRAIGDGLGIAPRHAGLLALQRRLGCRQKPALSFLARGHGLNRWLGRWRHERLSE